jgi:hypothetical protein
MPKKPASPPAAAAPPEGTTRADYFKVGISIPPSTYTRLFAEISRRKLAKLPNSGASAIITEALDSYLPPESLGTKRGK